MSEPLVVLIGDSVAGRLTPLRGGRLRFDYEDEYRRRPGATPLSLSMPTQVRSHPHGVITPWLWGLLPENERVLARWARHFQASASSPFSLLSTPIGEDCAGAVQFIPEGQEERVLARRGVLERLSSAGVAQRLRDLREDSTAWLGASFTGQFSLAGAQAKTALLYRNGRWAVPSGATATSHILKPQIIGLDEHDLNEHLCLDAARRAGLRVVRTRIGHFEDESAIIVTRYDRALAGNEVVRVHQEDLCQALGLRPESKYQNAGGPSPGRVVALFRSVMAPAIAEESVLRFLDALIWNWLIAGTDAHAKNYSLLLSGGEVRFAPLYDIASALPYRVHEKKLRLAMKLGDSYGVHPRRSSWGNAADELGLDRERVVERARELAARAPEAFAEAAATPEIAALESALPARLTDLVAERSARCLNVLQ